MPVPGPVRPLVVRGGHVLDPGSGLDAPMDVLVDGPRIAAVDAPGAFDGTGHPVLDASGCHVGPGFIDLHVHVDTPATGLGVDVDAIGVGQGVTTVADAGSTGLDTHPAFHRDIVKAATTRVVTWLNLAPAGLSQGLSELAGPLPADPGRVRALLDAHPGIRGIKVRMSRSVVGGQGIAPLLRARALADDVGLPVMAHVGQAPPALGEVAAHLRSGDVVTHALHGKGDGLLTDGGRVAGRVLDARRRGVRFDVGHGSASFSFEVARRALAEGFRADTVSTDLHSENADGPVHSLAETMGKLLAVGYTLNEVVAAVTRAPAAVLGRPDLGVLRAGAAADLTVFRVEEAEHVFTDSTGALLRATRIVRPVGAVRGGVHVPAL
ncbi:amidohydrolase/deacetylase family metallohydrolase [Nocardiopsis sediminis]|uniref:Amidohydrolase/deacetylase family metallohydrolase n=1 Tax=Nocardiopsis sediminis TaxID=1778267 RepID=A0ABV8FYT2_9ACTN